MFYLPACGLLLGSRSHTPPRLSSSSATFTAQLGTMVSWHLESSGFLVWRYRGRVAALKMVLSCVEASRVATAVLANPEGS